MSDTAILIIIGVVVVLAIVVWLLYLAAGLVLMFTAFVMELPTMVAILMFILFPPTLIAYLVGLAFIQFGVTGTLAPSDSEQRSQYLASSTDNQSPETTNTKTNNDVKPMKPLLPTKIPDGLAGLDWLAKYAKDEEPTENISAGPRVVVTSFGVFEKGDIVYLRAIGRATCYLNGIAVAKSVVAENTRPVDESGLIPHIENA